MIRDDDRGENVTCCGFSYDGGRREGNRLVVVGLARESDCCVFETVCGCLGWGLETHAYFATVRGFSHDHDRSRKMTFACLWVCSVACNPLVSLSFLDPVVAKVSPDAASSATSFPYRTLHLAFACCTGLVTVADDRAHGLLRDLLPSRQKDRCMVGLELYFHLRGPLDAMKATSEGGDLNMLTHLP